jgi:hypothetical protein
LSARPKSGGSRRELGSAPNVVGVDCPLWWSSDRVHFATIAGILAALLDKLTDGPDIRDKLLAGTALASLNEYESDTLTDTERAIVDRMTRRIAAGGSLDLTYGDYRPSPSPLAGSASPTSWGRADDAHRR